MQHNVCGVMAHKHTDDSLSTKCHFVKVRFQGEVII